MAKSSNMGLGLQVRVATEVLLKFATWRQEYFEDPSVREAYVEAWFGWVPPNPKLQACEMFLVIQFDEHKCL